jgi:hypothetical protein
MSKKFSVPILELKPTQFAVGLLEVDEKVKRLKKLSPKELKKKIAKKVVPIIVSPWGEFCLVDRHHFVLELWHLGVKKVRCEIVRDFSKSGLSYPLFWRRIARLGYAHLYDQFGEGMRSAFYLPNDIRGLADDPYRSLAWMVREAGGYEKTETKFSEFEWAGYFRKRKLLDRDGKRGITKAVERGCRLAHLASASGLPGFLGKTARTRA